VGEDAGRDMSEHTGTLRVTIREAAARLGVTEGAVRKRIQRGTLPQEQGEDGRVYVYLPVSHDSSREQSRTEPLSSSLGSDPRDELIVQLRGEVEAWREESRRKDTIIMNMTEAMKALNPPEPRPAQEEEEVPQETPEPRTEATPQPGRVEPQTPLEGAQEPRESSEMHMPEAGGGPLPRDQQRASAQAPRRWWEFWR
jgi:hypothetical protein